MCSNFLTFFVQLYMLWYCTSQYRHSETETTQFPFSKNPATNSELVTSIKAKSVESSFKYFACESESWHENSCVICFEGI
jgi:hypothetical protein